MDDLRRQILEQVRSGELSPEDAAERLENIEPEPPQTGGTGSIARVRLVGDFLSAKVSADASVLEAVAEGPHSARREGDTLIITSEGAGEADTHEFRFSKTDRPRVILGLGSKPRPVVVRMNPALALEADISVGSLSVDGVRGPINASIDAGSVKVEGAASPVDLSVDAGSVQVTALLDRGASRVRCDAGSVKVSLTKGSSVRVVARTDIGKVVLGDGTATKGLRIGGTSDEHVFGDGAGTLDVQTGVGRVVVQEIR